MAFNFNPNAPAFVMPACASSVMAAQAARAPPPASNKPRRRKRQPSRQRVAEGTSRPLPEANRLARHAPDEYFNARADDDSWSFVSSEAWSVIDSAQESFATASVAPSLAGDAPSLAGDVVWPDPNDGAADLDSTCTVCCEPLLPTDAAACMRDCAHLFHRECLERWLKRSPSCPNCRMAADPRQVLERAQLSAEAIAQLQLTQGMVTARTQASDGERGPGGGGRGGGARGAATAAADWDGNLHVIDDDDDDDGNASVASMASDVSFRSVTTVRGWPHISRPRALPAMAAAVADSLSSSGASYADALLRCGTGSSSGAEAATDGSDAAAATTRLAPRPPTVRSRAVAAGGGDGASVVQGRVMLTMPRSRIRRSASARGVGGGGTFRRGELCSVDEEGDEW